MKITRIAWFVCLVAVCVSAPGAEAVLRFVRIIDRYFAQLEGAEGAK